MGEGRDSPVRLSLCDKQGSRAFPGTFLIPRVKCHLSFVASLRPSCENITLGGGGEPGERSCEEDATVFSKHQEALNVISLVALRDPLPQPCVCEAALHAVTHRQRPHPTPVSVTSCPWPPGPQAGQAGRRRPQQSSCWPGIYRLQVNGGQVWQQGCIWRFISQRRSGVPCVSCPGRV